MADSRFRRPDRWLSVSKPEGAGTQGKLKRRDFLKAAGLGVAALTLPGCMKKMEPDGGLLPDQPANIVLIMADDMGAECLSCYGSTSYNTPNLDALAASGVQFNNAYCTPLCTPTRVEIMTGQYPFRSGWTKLIGGREEYIALPTFGNMLQDAGYATAVAGKWQLAYLDDRPNHPYDLGFDEYCLWKWKYGDNKPSRYWTPGIVKNGEVMEDMEDKYGPDIFSDFIVDFIERNQSKLFFAYYPMVLTHKPYVPPPGVAEDKSKASNDQEIQQYFTAMVEYADKMVGKIVHILDTVGLRERTLVLFTGDNGTPKEVRSQIDGQTIYGGKANLSEAGTRVPLIASWQGITPAGTVYDDLIDHTDVVPTLGEISGGSIGLKADGRSFLPQLKGGQGNPRDWVYCQLADNWFIRDRRWRLRNNGELADMTDRYSPRIMGDSPGSPEEAEAIRRLGGVVEALHAS